ncbi:MAG: hypothetical protein NZ899_11820 [Thermoguttaceae bacterium]|nr:hypothetical protein [Thermoguttaceae bacterium]MDW8079364.1 hypothetical protein [Thermoguttaceae bacterium]
MCESCELSLNRREFLGTTFALSGAASALAASTEEPKLAPRPKDPPVVDVVFLYPPADVVNAGELEDHWRVHQWFTWPGNQFQPEEQEKKFKQKLQEMAGRLGIHLQLAPRAIYQSAAVQQFIEAAKNGRPDAVLVINFWNTFAEWSYRIATEVAPRAIVYQPVGSNHQLPRDFLRNTPGLWYIHSIENWPELERSLRAIRACKMLAQSRLLRVSTKVEEPTQESDPDLGVDIVHVPTSELIAIFDSIEVNDQLVAQASELRRQAAAVWDVTDQFVVEAVRAHQAVQSIMARYGADAITIECLMLKHRKPCISFALLNGQLVPAGCENMVDGTITMMIGRWLWDRAGFMHNPEFDTTENLYMGAHCTCAWKLHGPEGAEQKFIIRPFFHQLPKTAALDVQWTPGEPVVLAKYYSGGKKIACWTGEVIASPPCPPVGGCATRVLVKFDKVEDVCSVYPGIHPILFCVDRKDARALRAFAHLNKFEWVGNI